MTELKDRVEEVLRIYNEYENSPTETGMGFVFWHELKNEAVKMGGIIKDQQSRITELEEKEKALNEVVDSVEMNRHGDWDVVMAYTSIRNIVKALESIKGE